jgi:hypothetical protein
MKGWVYFARLGDDGPIKIGKAVNPRRRVSSLGSISPYSITLLAAMPCADAAAEEQRLHELLVADRIKGEWFSATAVLEEMRRLEGRLVPLDRLPGSSSSETLGRSVVMRVRISEEDESAWKKAAARAGQSLSAWIRDGLNAPHVPKSSALLDESDPSDEIADELREIESLIDQESQ